MLLCTVRSASIFISRWSSLSQHASAHRWRVSITIVLNNTNNKKGITTWDKTGGIRYISSSSESGTKELSVDAALHHLHTQLLTRSDPFPCLTFVKLLAKASSVSQAEELFYLAQESGHGKSIQLYNAKLDFHLVNNQLDLFLETRDLMKHQKIAPDYNTHVLLIRAFCNEGDVNSALKTLSDLEKDITITMLDENAFLPFMKHYVAKNNPMEVVAIYEDMKRKRVPITTNVYMMLLNAAKSGGVNSLDSVVNQMSTVDGLQLDESIISTYVDVALRLKDLKAAERMVNRGFNECKLLPRLKPLTFLASTYAKYKQLDRLFGLFEKIVKLEYVADETFFQFMISCFTLKYCTTQIDQFREYMKVKNITCTQASYVDIIKFYAEAGKSQKMMNAFNEMKDLYPVTTPVYSAMLKCYSRADMINEAEMVKQLSDRESRSLSLPSYKALLEAYYRRHNPQKAKGVLKSIAAICKTKQDLAELADLENSYKMRYE